MFSNLDIVSLNFSTISLSSPITSKPQPSLEHFHSFTKLAPELRLKIWLFACFPRTLTLKYTANENQFTTTTTPPTLLSVSRESRLIALETYTLSFSTTTSPAHIYFSPKQDTLYLPRCREMGYDETLRDFRELVSAKERGTVVEQIREVAIDHVDAGIKRPWEAYNKASFIRSFPSLQQITLVLSPSPNRRIGNRPFEYAGMFNEWAPSVTSVTSVTSSDHRSEISLEKKDMVEFVQPKIEPEVLVRVWACFRKAFVLEERALKGVCEQGGREYSDFTLPVVYLKEKIEKQQIKEIIFPSARGDMSVSVH